MAKVTNLTEKELQKKTIEILKSAGHFCWAIDAGGKQFLAAGGARRLRTLDPGFPDVYGFVG